MKKRQNRKGNIATSEKIGNRKRSTSKGPGNISSKRNTAGEIKPESKAGNEEMWEFVSEEIVSKCEDLKSVCKQIEKLEKEKQRLLYVILKDVPKKKRIRK